MPGTSAEIERKLGLSMNSDAHPERQSFLAYQQHQACSIKTKEVKQECFFTRLSESIERDKFQCLSLKIIILFVVKYDVSSMNQIEIPHAISLVFQIDSILGTTKQHKSWPKNTGKCICKSLEFQNFAGEHAPKPP